MKKTKKYLKVQLSEHKLQELRFALRSLISLVVLAACLSAHRSQFTCSFKVSVDNLPDSLIKSVND